jgi:hypothetical protein
MDGPHQRHKSTLTGVNHVVDKKFEGAGAGHDVAMMVPGCREMAFFRSGMRDHGAWQRLN